MFVLSYEIVVPSPQKAFTKMRDGMVPCDLVIDNFGAEFPCHAVVVYSVAPKLLEYKSKSNGGKINLETPDKLGLLKKIMDFCYGEDFVVNPDNCVQAYLMTYMIGLSLISDAAYECMKKSISPATICPTILYLNRYHVDCSMYIQYIKDHFSEIMTNTDLYHLPLPILEEILNSDSICSDNEDNIAYFIQHVIERRGKEANSLLDSIHLNEVSKDTIIDLCATQGIDSKELIEKSKREEEKPRPSRNYRLNTTQMDTLIKTGKHIDIQFPADEKVPTGIINYILKQGGKVRVVVSSTHDKYFDSQNLLKLDNFHNIWYSKNTPDQFALIDFSPYMICPNKYYIRTSGGNKGSGHLCNWTLTASNDMNKWDLLDRKLDNEDLNGGYKSASYNCDCQEYYRYIRIQQVGYNLRNDFSMTLSCIELYGQLLKAAHENE